MVDIGTSLEALPEDMWFETLMEEVFRLERAFDGLAKCHYPISLDVVSPRRLRLRSLRAKSDHDLLGLLHQYHSVIMRVFIEGTGEDILWSIPHLVRQYMVVLGVMYDRRRGHWDTPPQRWDKDTVKAAVNIADVAGAYTELRAVNHQHAVGLCPLHAETDPSFHVYLDSPHWYCYGCNQGGDVFALVQAVEGVNFPEAIDYVARYFWYRE